MELRRGALTHELFYFDIETCNTKNEVHHAFDSFVLDSHYHLVNMDKNAVAFKNPPDCTKMQSFFSWLPTKAC